MAETRNPGSFLGRFAFGIVPICLVLLLIVAAAEIGANTATFVAVFVGSTLVLWFGRGWICQTLVTKWTGIIVAVCVVPLLLLYALGVAIPLLSVGFRVAEWISVPFIVLLVVAGPYILYDLFFRQPYQGRFARAREDRRLRSRP
jgi:membrane protease YdiL (CAAX protease family)